MSPKPQEPKLNEVSEMLSVMLAANEGYEPTTQANDGYESDVSHISVDSFIEFSA